MATFNEALAALEQHLTIAPGLLVEYAAELDVKGGREGGNESATAYTRDAQLLYAMVRLLLPEKILESGTNFGGSANHLLAALAKNGMGKLVTIDTTPDSGDFIFDEYLGQVDVLIEDICEYVQRPEATAFDFIYEDASHEVHTVRAVYEALPTLAPNGCFVISHDTATGVEEAILTGIKDAGHGPVYDFRHDDGTCGFVLYEYKGV